MLMDDQGQAAVVGVTRGLWLDDSDFVAGDAGDACDTGDVPVERLGFPTDWPAAYSSTGLKGLIGKRGKLPAKRVALAGEPLEEEKAEIFSKKVLETVSFPPLQSFSNALRAADVASVPLSVVRGWVIWELLEGQSGTGRFLAERYWWNSREGRWLDVTPRPAGTAQLLLVEPTEPAPTKSPQALSPKQAQLAARYLKAKFPHFKRPEKQAEQPAFLGPAKETKEVKEVKKAEVKEVKVKEVKEVKPREVKPKVEKRQTKASTLDYSKWSNIVDSDDEEDPRVVDEDVGVKDLAEGAKAKKEPPIPDYLLGSTGGGGGTNCLTSIVKMLDSEQTQENVHQLAQVFGRSFHSAMLDVERQEFYRKALELLTKSVPSAFVVILGLGSVLPMLRAKQHFQGMLLESSEKLGKLAEELLKSNKNENFEDEESILEVLRPQLVRRSTVVVLTERMAHDLLSNGIVPCCLSCHKAVKKLLPSAEILHIPQTVELLVAPGEIRSDRLGSFDIRAGEVLALQCAETYLFQREGMDNQQNTICSILGPSKTLCGFDFQRAPEIGLEEVRRPLKLQATQRGRCNCACLWWVAKFQHLEFSTRPALADGKDGKDGKDGGKAKRSEWKQAIHYLAGETALFPGDVIELLVSITPRFTFRMMQQSPMSVEAPMWVQAPTNSKFSATLPILPYHFLMMTDLERLDVYQRALKASIKQQAAKLGRRVRVLDAGCGIGLLGLSAALEGAEVWLCEAVPLMRHVCREVVAANSSLVAEKRGLVQLLPPMMSTRLHTEEVPKFDIVVSEVMDLWCLGEGIIPTMRHAHKKLLAPNGVLLPGKLRVYVQPLELSLWREVEEGNQVDLQSLSQRFRSKFSALRIDQFPHRYLTKEPILAMEIDLANLPAQPAEGEANIEGGVKLCIRMGKKPALSAKVVSSKIHHRGMLSGYGLWWSADLAGHQVTSDPSNPQRSWKQLVRWLDEPRFVEEQEEIQVLTCYNDQQVNVEDIHLTREMIEQYQQQQAATLNVSS